jgi:hypothetical protein
LGDKACGGRELEEIFPLEDRVPNRVPTASFLVPFQYLFERRERGQRPSVDEAGGISKSSVGECLVKSALPIEGWNCTGVRTGAQGILGKGHWKAGGGKFVFDSEEMDKGGFRARAHGCAIGELWIVRGIDEEAAKGNGDIRIRQRYHAACGRGQKGS